MVVGWQVYDLTHSTLALGLIGLVEAVPAIALALFAGQFIDRANPLTVYKNVVRLVIVSALILCAVSGGGGLPPPVRLGAIFFASFLGGVAGGFAMPARDAIVPRLVERAQLHETSAWTVSSFHVASIAGPALGGALYAWLGPRFVYGVDAALGAASALLLAAMTAKFPAAPERREESGLEAALSGLRHVFSHRVLLPAISLDMFAVLFGGVTAILPVFAKDILLVGPMGLGVLRAAPAAGALLASAWLIRRPVRRHAGAILLWVVAGFGMTILGFALSRSFVLSAVLLALGGAFDSVSMVIRVVIIQLNSPDAMRGRISSVNSVFISVSNELGAFESGLAASLLGVVPSVVAGGVVTMATVAAVALWSHELRRMHLDS
jgi:predicted MFS family arabinose efflux permease